MTLYLKKYFSISLFWGHTIHLAQLGIRKGLFGIPHKVKILGFRKQNKCRWRDGGHRKSIFRYIHWKSRCPNVRAYGSKATWNNRKWHIRILQNNCLSSWRQPIHRVEPFIFIEPFFIQIVGACWAQNTFFLPTYWPGLPCWDISFTQVGEPSIIKIKKVIIYF